MPVTFNMQIADVLFRVQAQHGYTRDYCADYLVADGGQPAISLVLDDRLTQREREITRQADAAAGRPVRHYRDCEYEATALLRACAQQLLQHGVLLCHGSVVVHRGKAYLFTCASGGGKSTHAALWCQNMPDCHSLNDDKPFLKIDANGVTAFGTPWTGKHGRGCNERAPLAGICRIVKAGHNSIRPIAASQGFSWVSSQVFRPENPVDLLKAMGLADTLCRAVPLWELECLPNAQAAQVSFAAMTEARHGC